MKRNASLALTEQVIMLLILIVAAALCLRAFVWSDKQSLYYANRDRGLVELQSTAEILKAFDGDLSTAAEFYGGSATQGQWVIEFDENWNITEAPGTYRIRVSILTEDEPYLGSAILTVQTIAGDVFAELPVSWQEVVS